MSAAKALKAARAAGIDLAIDGDDLVLTASAPPTASVLDLLSQYKVEVLSLLRPADDAWSAENWREFFDERAAIAEFDCGLPRAEAEARAFACCVGEWLNRNPVRSAPDRCARCGGDEFAHDPLLPHGVASPGHAWLHSRCWSAWHAGRKAQAVAALAAMGMARPAKLPDDFGKNGGARWAD